MTMSPPRRAMSPAAERGWSSPVFRRSMDALDQSSTRPNAMEALKKQVKNMEPDAVPRMLHHVGSASSKHRKRFAVSLLEVCAKEHGHHITPLIPQLMATVVEHLSPAAGTSSDSSQPHSPTGSHGSTDTSTGNGPGVASNGVSSGGVPGVNERAGMGSANGGATSASGNSVFDFSGDAADLHKACAQVAVTIVTHCPRTRTEEGLVLSEVCSALGNALVAPHSLIVQTGAAACLVSISSKMERTKLPRHTQELLGQKLLVCLGQPVRPVPALHFVYYFVRHHPNMSKRLGSPLLRITRDILVGPTSSQERLLAARVVQEVIARCDSAAFQEMEEGLTEALEGLKGDPGVHPMLRRVVQDALMAIWMVKLNNNTREQGFGFRSGTASPVDFTGGGGGSPRFAGGLGHNRAFSYHASSPSTPFIHSPGTASPTRAGPGIPGMLGMPFGGTGSFSPSQSQALYLTQLQLQAQAQAQVRAQSQSQCASPVSQSPTRARPSPVAGTPPHFASFLATPLSRGSSIISPPTPLAKKGIPQDARTLPFPPLVSPIRTSHVHPFPHPHPHSPPPDTVQGMEGVSMSVSSPDPTIGAALAPDSLPIPVPVSASEDGAGAGAAAAAECDLSEAKSGTNSGRRTGAESRTERVGESGSGSGRVRDSGSGHGSGGEQKADPVAVNLSPALDAAAAEAAMEEELATNGKLRIDSTSEVLSTAPGGVKRSGSTPRQPLHTLSTLNNSQSNSNSSISSTSGSGSGANQPGLSPRSDQKERRTGSGTVDAGAVPPSRTSTQHQKASPVAPGAPALGVPKRDTPGAPSRSAGDVGDGVVRASDSDGSGAGSEWSSSSQAGKPGQRTPGPGEAEPTQGQPRAGSVHGTPDSAAMSYSDRTPRTVSGAKGGGGAAMEALVRAAAAVPGVGDILRGLQGSQTGRGPKSDVPDSPGSTVTQEGEAEGDSEGSSSSECTSKLRAEPVGASTHTSRLSPAGSANTEGPGGMEQFLEAKEELKDTDKDGGSLLELRLGPRPKQGKGAQQVLGQGKGTPPSYRAGIAGSDSGSNSGGPAVAQDALYDASTSPADLTLRLGPPEPPFFGSPRGAGDGDVPLSHSSGTGAAAGGGGEEGRLGRRGAGGVPPAAASKGVGRFHISPANEWNVGSTATPQLPKKSKDVLGEEAAAKTMSPRTLFQKLQSPILTGELDRDDEVGAVGQGQPKGQMRGKPTDGGLAAPEAAKKRKGGVSGGDKGVKSEEGMKEFDEEGKDGEVYVVDDDLWALIRTFKVVQRWEKTAAFQKAAGMLSRTTRVANKVIEAAMLSVLAVFASILLAVLLQAANQDTGFLPS